MRDIKDYRKLFAGVNMPVALEDGECVVPINFDNAATTPPFKCVNNCIMEHILMYGSIGRGKGQKSEYCTDVYEESREFILDFFNLGSRQDYTVVYVKNTTEGINLLAKALIKDKCDIVLTTRMEHHANDLPWRNTSSVEYIEVDDKGKIDLDSVETILKKFKGKVKLVSITGASNVTGYINSINKLAEISHRYGAKIVVDGAQIVAHRSINMSGYNDMDSIDFLVFSGHKLYAPFGSGAVVGLRRDLDDGDPLVLGGGAVETVLDKDVYWEGAPLRYEAGTPNFLGVIALISAMKSLISIGFNNIKSHEDNLRDYMLSRISKVDRITLYGDYNEKERLGVVPFNIDGIGDNIVAQRLADYRGVSVRHGGFCAHPYVRRLLGISNKEAYNYVLNGVSMPGMVRASFGLYNTKLEVDDFIDTLEMILTRHG